MSLLNHPHPSDEELGSSNKRRKVNTCLQCKSRKVKCDKMRPHCGPCQRRRIPVGECVFADEADPETLMNYLGPEYVANQGFDLMDAAVQPDQALLELDDPQARAVLDRITREMRLREAVGESQNLTDGVAQAAAAIHNTIPTPATDVDLQLSQTLIAEPSADNTGAAPPAGSLYASSQLPLIENPSPDTKKHILGLLPNDHVVNVLLDSLKSFETKSPLGISWRLIRIQLINLRGEISDWRSGQIQEPDVDLSFLALLFELMVAAIDCKPMEEIISEGIALTSDQVSEITKRWHSTSVTLLAMCKADLEPNLNTVFTTFLFYLYSIRRGASRAAHQHLHISLRNAELLGMHHLGDAVTDAKRWESTPDDKDTTIRTGAVTAVRKALFEGGRRFALAEERHIIESLQDSSTPHRSPLAAQLPDRSHLVREAARTIYISLSWHFVFLSMPSPYYNRPKRSDAHTRTLRFHETGDRTTETFTDRANIRSPFDSDNMITKPARSDEAYLPDGDTLSLPDVETSAATDLFILLWESTGKYERFITKDIISRDRRDEDHECELDVLEHFNDWMLKFIDQIDSDDEDSSDGHDMLDITNRLIVQWTYIKTLRRRQMEGSRKRLVELCEGALTSVQKLVATPGIHLSIFRPLVSLVSVDVLFLLALHLLDESRSTEILDAKRWHKTRSLVINSLSLLWSAEDQNVSTRLGGGIKVHKSVRQLVEQMLLEAFKRRAATLNKSPKVKSEDQDTPAQITADRLEQTVGPMDVDDPLRAYLEAVLSEEWQKTHGGRPIYYRVEFHEALDDYFKCM